MTEAAVLAEPAQGRGDRDALLEALDDERSMYEARPSQYANSRSPPAAPPQQRVDDPVRRLVHQGPGLPAARLRRIAEAHLPARAARVSHAAGWRGRTRSCHAGTARRPPGRSPGRAGAPRRRGPLPAEAAQGQVPLDGRPQPGQAAGDLPHVRVLRLLLSAPELLVVQVLPAARLVRTDGLDGPVGPRAHPDVPPRRRNHEGPDPGPVLRAQRRALGVQVAESAAVADPPPARPAWIAGPEPHPSTVPPTVRFRPPRPAAGTG